MHRALLLLLLLLLAPGAARAQSPYEARVTHVDTSRYPEVTVYVRVTDASGAPVSGLGSDAFQLREDGQLVALADFAAAGDSQVSAVLVIDRSGSMEEAGKMAGARDAARAFVDQMRPGDQTALIAFSDAPELIEPFSGDADALRGAIRRIRAGGSTALYDSLIAGVEALDGVSGRRALLLLTDGRDIISTDNPRPASTRTLDEAIAAAREAGVSVQVIGLGERGSGDLRAGIDEDVLRRIADETGGEYFYAPEAAQLVDLYRGLSAGMQQEYALTYRSPRPFYDGTRRDIQVSVGGAPFARADYLQKHMINVRSDPLVGGALLLPIAGALLLPLAWRRRRMAGRQAAHRPPATDDRRLAADQPPTPIAEPARPVAVPVARGERCAECGGALRAGAKFCGRCGAPA